MKFTTNNVQVRRGCHQDVRFGLLLSAGLTLALILAGGLTAAEPLTLDLWPSTPPGETKELPPEADTTGADGKLVAGRRVIRLGNVSVPQLTIYRPHPDQDTGAAVIICPGGGHSILAYDLEGTEVAEWLNSIGVTGVVLKYRVPARDKSLRWRAACQDAQRAISLVRSKSEEWHLDSARIGILGFSAGGETAGRAATLHNQRQYTAVDAADQVSCRPDFAVLVYPGGFVDKVTGQLPESVHIDEHTPPMFLVHAFDDRVSPESSLLLLAALKKAGVASELHIFDRGGHGYGLRPTEMPITGWPELCARWMQTAGWLHAANTNN